MKTLYQGNLNHDFAFRLTVKERIMSFAEKLLITIIMIPFSLLASIWLIWLCIR